MSQLEDRSRDRAALDRSEDTFRLMSMLQVLQCVMALTSCWPDQQCAGRLPVRLLRTAQATASLLY